MVVCKAFQWLSLELSLHNSYVGTAPGWNSPILWEKNQIYLEVMCLQVGDRTFSTVEVHMTKTPLLSDLCLVLPMNEDFISVSCFFNNPHRSLLFHQYYWWILESHLVFHSAHGFVISTQVVPNKKDRRGTEKRRVWPSGSKYNLVEKTSLQIYHSWSSQLLLDQKVLLLSSPLWANGEPSSVRNLKKIKGNVKKKVGTP